MYSVTLAFYFLSRPTALVKTQAVGRLALVVRAGTVRPVRGGLTGARK